MLLRTVKDMWEALEAKLGDSNASRELNVMEQLYDYKTFDGHPVVDQPHKITNTCKRT
jgi:hypothetical protein